MPTNRIIEDAKGFPIQPEMIDAQDHLWDAFDNNETEVSAGWIVRFLQEKGQGWTPFSLEGINHFYNEKHSEPFNFNRLVNPEWVPPSLARAFEGHNDPKIPKGGGWIVLGEDGLFRVTDDFVLRCYKSSPAK